MCLATPSPAPPTPASAHAPWTNTHLRQTRKLRPARTKPFPPPLFAGAWQHHLRHHLRRHPHGHLRPILTLNTSNIDQHELNLSLLPFSQVLGNTISGTTYAGIRARTTAAPQQHWFGPSGDPRSGGIHTAEAIKLCWSSHREIIYDHAPVASDWEGKTT